ncbi:class I SAM-dependent methyltransferase [Dactylosporangium roseum]|uniref:Class I SAM-dependent methyltransferase n=1 Tax=Dactylosporangium roseum TaxID=47989 RepID=A0ABY5ZDV8_9ACTN|nr:class I SAM-dependent methyltransferase [Dactylosporangium roseum]UWZ39133.1 class I SAM-dependent methyltransferase [Dactylosporangium roseum]
MNQRTTWKAEDFGEVWAPLYDHMFDRDDTADAVPALIKLADGGRVLELGIGTGRLAIPMAEAGLDVHGVEASPAMAEQMRAKPGGDRIPVTIGDFTQVRAEGRFDFIFCAYNTFFALPTQDDQCRFMTNAATQLAPDGRLLVEVFVPDLGKFHDDQVVRAADLDDGHTALEVERYDPVTQQIFYARVIAKARWAKHRYCWPTEIDLMARLAGLELTDRWGGWCGEPFDRHSTRHVSVYRRPAGTTT